MATTTFTDQETVIQASWLNDVDNAVYLLLDGAVGTGTAARAALAGDWSGSNSGTFSELTDAATVAVDFSVANNLYVTVTANRTIGAPSNKVAGQAGVIVVEQDAGGTNVTTFHADWDFGDTGNPTPDTTGDKKAVIAYFVDWDLVVVSTFVGDF